MSVRQQSFMDDGVLNFADCFEVWLASVVGGKAV